MRTHKYIYIYICIYIHIHIILYTYHPHTNIHVHSPYYNSAHRSHLKFKEHECFLLDRPFSKNTCLGIKQTFRHHMYLRSHFAYAIRRADQLGTDWNRCVYLAYHNLASSNRRHCHCTLPLCSCTVCAQYRMYARTYVRTLFYCFTKW